MYPFVCPLVYINLPTHCSCKQMHTDRANGKLSRTYNYTDMTVYYGVIYSVGAHSSQKSLTRKKFMPKTNFQYTISNKIHGQDLIQLSKIDTLYYRRKD